MIDPDEMRETLGDLAKIQQLQRVNEQLSNLQSRSGLDCPHCGGPIPKNGVKICMHCRNNISWVGRTPCEPGTESETQNRILSEARESEFKKHRTRRILRLIVYTSLAAGSLYSFFAIKSEIHFLERLFLDLSQ